MDLTSLYRMVSAEAPSVPEQMMRGAANQAALQQVDEQLMANKRLRDLYSSGGQPSMQDLMSIDPRLGIEMQQAQFKNMLEAGQIEKLNREKQEHESKVYAQHISPIAQDYFDDIKKGMPEQQAEYKFRSAVGQAQADIEQRFGIKPQTDFAQFSPMQIAQRAHSLGVDIPHLKEIEEQQKNQFAMQQKMSPGYADVAGRTEAGPYGPRFVPPAPMPGSRQPRGTGLGGAPATQMPDGYQRATAEDLPMLEQEYANATDVNEKQMIGSLINQLKQQTQFVTPEQEAQMRIQEKEKEIRAAEGAKADVQRAEEGKRITESFKRAMGEGGVSGVMNLIANSTSGPTETFGADIASRIPKEGGSTATSGMVNIGRLGPIAKELKKTIERSPGPQSDKDVAIDALAAASIDDPKIPYNQRMEGFLEFVRIIKERANSLGIDPKELGIDVDTETGKKLTEGHKEDGYTFKGGDPSDPKNWEKD